MSAPIRTRHQRDTESVFVDEGPEQHRRVRRRPGQNTAGAQPVRPRSARHVDGCAKKRTHPANRRHVRLSPRRICSAPGTAATPRSSARGATTPDDPARPACRPHARRRRVAVAILPAGRRVGRVTRTLVCDRALPVDGLPASGRPAYCIGFSSVPSRRPSSPPDLPVEQDVARIAEVSGLSPPHTTPPASSAGAWKPSPESSGSQVSRVRSMVDSQFEFAGGGAAMNTGRVAS